MLDSLESQIFSRVKAYFSERIKKKYPDLSFTTVDKSSTKPKFPTVYIHMLSSPESGSDTEGDNVNAIYAAFQVDITDNQSQSRADEVSKEVLRIMKVMRFQALGMPFHDNTGDTFRTASRYRRMIADNDIL